MARGPVDAIQRESGVTSGVSQTQASSTEMRSTADQFEQVNGEITSTLKRLMGELSILNTSWQGLAAGQFHKVKERYEQDLTTLNKALAETAESIRMSAGGYDTTDSDAAARVTKSGGGGINLPL